MENSTSCKKSIKSEDSLSLYVLSCVVHLLPADCSSSEPDVEATLDKMFDELAFKQNDSKWTFKYETLGNPTTNVYSFHSEVMRCVLMCRVSPQ